LVAARDRDLGTYLLEQLANPIPLLPAVITATFPSRVFMISSFRFFVMLSADGVG
jgi:hypothetical protein